MGVLKEKGLSIEDLRNDPDFNEHVNGIIAAKKREFVSREDTQTAEWSKRLDELRAQTQSASEKLAATQEEAKRKTEEATNLEKELQATRREMLREVTRNKIIETAAHVKPKNLKLLADLLESRVQIGSDNALTLEGKPLADAIRDMTISPDTAFLFGDGGKSGTMLPTPSNQPVNAPATVKEAIAGVFGIG